MISLDGSLEGKLDALTSALGHCLPVATEMIQEGCARLRRHFFNLSETISKLREAPGATCTSGTCADVPANRAVSNNVSSYSAPVEQPSKRSHAMSSVTAAPVGAPCERKRARTRGGKAAKAKRWVRDNAMHGP